MVARQWFYHCDDRDQVEHIVVTHEPFAGERVFDSTIFVHNPNRGSVPSWNAGAKFSHGRILIGLADDLFPCPHWDAELLKVIPEISEPYVVEVDHADGSDILTHIFETRAYYEALGYMHHPDYTHLMADVEFGNVARATGRVIDARHLIFPHKSVEEIGWPAEYQRFRNPAKEFLAARELYARREAAGFPKASVLEVACR
jgi:GT2 family glycosyltransferase